MLSWCCTLVLLFPKPFFSETIEVFSWLDATALELGKAYSLAGPPLVSGEILLWDTLDIDSDASL